MRPDGIERIRFRQRVVVQCYVGASTTSPAQIVDYLFGQALIVTRHLPLSTRIIIAERARDLGDAIERRVG